MTEDEIKQEVALIEDPANWPAWPILPMKHINRNERPEGEGFGVILASEPTSVFLKNMYSLRSGPVREQLADAKVFMFESIEEMVRAGWIGD